ncbi:hypothetical protein [Rhodosalinus sp.]|uniref:hypothetical protein n=1 Tax=Rhodosalinus sp. TaxID=2047741 RepID=UPI0035699262
MPRHQPRVGIMQHGQGTTHYRSDRLAALLARLGSDADGERMATLRLLDRELERAGASWAELAGRLAAPAAQQPPAAREAGGPVFTRPQEAAKWVWRHPGFRPRNARERDFVASLQNWPRRPSAKQVEWIAKIVARLGGEVVR